jgi:hypothetical protein
MPPGKRSADASILGNHLSGFCQIIREHLLDFWGRRKYYRESYDGI